MVIPAALFLIPLTRFPAFVWLVAAGFLLPKSAPVVPASGGGDRPAVHSDESAMKDRLLTSDTSSA
jgi:hypothetical protein